MDEIKKQQFRAGLVKDLNAAKRDLRRAKAHVAEIEGVIAHLDAGTGVFADAGR